MLDQISFGTDDFAENPEPRLPCVLLLDTSGSMHGRPIDELNAGLAAFRDTLAEDTLAAKRVEVAVVTFGGPPRTVCDFTTAASFRPPALSAGGDTPLGAAVLHGVEMVAGRKTAYRANGIAYYRPWVLLITDGGPTDSWAAAADAVRAGEEAKAFSFFAVGVEGAKFDVLKQVAVRDPLKLKGLQFRDLFLWLSASVRSVSRSNPGDAVPLADPTGPKGWASV